MNPLSPLTYYRRHKRQALMLTALMALAVMGLYLLIGLLQETYITPLYTINRYLSKFSLVQPDLVTNAGPGRRRPDSRAPGRGPGAAAKQRGNSRARMWGVAYSLPPDRPAGSGCGHGAGPVRRHPYRRPTAAAAHQWRGAFRGNCHGAQPENRRHARSDRERDRLCQHRQPAGTGGHSLRRCPAGDCVLRISG